MTENDRDLNDRNIKLTAFSWGRGERSISDFLAYAASFSSLHS